MIVLLNRKLQVTVYITVLLVAVIIALFLLTRDAAWPLIEKNSARSEAVLRLGRVFEYDEVVKLGEGHGWKHSNDSDVVMTYVRALVETGRALPNELRSPGTRNAVAVFAEAYMDLVKGHINRAESGFTSLTRSEEGRPWGYVGLFELSLMVRDFTAMGNWLAAWQALPEHQRDIQWVTPYYTASYLRGVGRYDDLAKLLAQPEVGKKLPPELLAPLRAELVLREDNFVEAHAILDEAIATVGIDAALVYAKASVISAEQGLGSASAYLRASQKHLPKAWPLEFQCLLIEVEGNVLTSAEAAGPLLAIAKRRLFDTGAVIDIALALFDINDVVGSVSLMEKLPVATDDKLRFASYNLLMAKFDLYQGLMDSLQGNLGRVRQIDPANPDLLWFEYAIARKEKNHENALEVVFRLLALDPNNKPALQAATRVYEEMGRWDDVLKVGERFLRSKRVISAKAQDEVRMRMQRAALPGSDRVKVIESR